MADQKPTTGFYKNLGGVNQKASLYELSIAQFLNLRNLDFDVPNALQKRPGTTYAISSASGTSGPISSIFEYVKLDGSSFIIAGTDSAMFYVANNAFTLLNAGWTNGQPTDMLTFENKAWMANGQYWKWWDGATIYPAGLPLSPRTVAAPFLWGSGKQGATTTYLFNEYGNNSRSGISSFTVNGATMIVNTSTPLTRCMYVAYSYLRSDGYVGPGDFQLTARNIIQSAPGNELEFFASGSVDPHSFQLGGFTTPSGYGISSVSIWFAQDTINTSSPIQNVPGVGNVFVGNLGWMVPGGPGFYGSYTMKPNADLSRFWLYTTMPTTNLFLTSDTQATYWAATFGFGGASSFGGTFAQFNGAPATGFSGMQGDFFSTYIPKFNDVNLNTMWMSGLSTSPSTLWFSEVGEPEFFNPDNFFDARTNDGDYITGHKSFNNQVIVTKEKSFHKVVGDSSDNYQLVQISDQYGCLSKKTMVFKDQLMYWLDKKGILEFNGANHQIISGPVEGIFRRMNLSAAKEKAVGIHHPYRNQLWWGIPIDGSTQNNITVVYDYMVGAWTFFDGFKPSSLASVKGALTRPTVWRGDYSGLPHYYGESFYSDSGSGITCLAFTRFDLAKENETWIWRRFFLDVATASGLTGTLAGQIFSDYDQSTVQATFSMYQNAFQSRAEMGVVGKAVACQFAHFSASLPLLINGYSWAKRGLRNV